jgi:hypothetical protein
MPSDQVALMTEGICVLIDIHEPRHEILDGINATMADTLQIPFLYLSATFIKDFHLQWIPCLRAHKMSKQSGLHLWMRGKGVRERRAPENRPGGLLDDNREGLRWRWTRGVYWCPAAWNADILGGHDNVVILDIASLWIRRKCRVHPIQ